MDKTKMTKESVLLNIFKSGLKLHRQDLIDLAIKRGFDLKQHRTELVSYCAENHYYDSLRLIDEDAFDKVIGMSKIKLTLKNAIIENFKRIYCLTNIVEIVINNCEVHSIDYLDQIHNLKKIVIFGIKNKGCGIIIKLKEFGEKHNIEIKDLTIQMTAQQMQIGEDQQRFLDLHEQAHLELRRRSRIDINAPLLTLNRDEG